MFEGYRTYIGLIVALVPTLANLFGYHATPAFSAQFPELADQFLQLLGLAVAFYGRAVSTSPGFLAKN